ncbi:P-loop NTPase [Parvularcula lutaonensis]|uniref:Iron-sulfur cluster carrier protein n=1 Tax=Parvularcula lutaonensis TaxID=491923 RepID=A0ABV7M9B6_9PROT|nr:P-loop NTPase [Parvularcula lutaonensis]
MMRRMREAAKKGRAEAALRKILSAEGLSGEVTIRSLDDRMAASVILQDAAEIDEGALSERLKAAAGLDRVTVVRTAHGGGAPTPAPAPKPAGGHADPLHLGSRPAQRPEPQRPEGVRAVVAVASGKGGVGKSTVAANLALSLRDQGLKVGLLDLDIHGPSLPVLFPSGEKLRSEDGKIVPAEVAGLKLVSIGYMVDERKAVAWRGPMVMNAARQMIDDSGWGDLDVLVVDTPPGTGDAHLSMVQRLKLDAAILVATPSPLATADVRRGAELFRKVGAPVLGVVLNMTGGPLGDDLDEGLLAELDLEILDRLPLSRETAQVPLESPQAELPAVLRVLMAKLPALSRDNARGSA